MNVHGSLRVRRSLEDLQDDYAKGNKKPLEDLMRAWKGIKDLPPTDPKSFFVLGGLHGEPFRGAGWGSNSYWGGYCNHGNVLFPTWHRVYLLKLEEALQSIPGCQDVMLPYWDEISDGSLQRGVPWALTQENFVLDGETIPNPLRSFVFNRNITDFIDPDIADYSKLKGYETVRYPLSGLVGSPKDRAATEKHNALYPNYDDNVKLLNRNVIAWLTSSIVVNGQTIPTSVKNKYVSCLNAPNYTLFSNTTSAAQWNTDRDDDVPPVVSLESPHNDIHLAVGGYDVPNVRDYSPIPGANGDMGENDTASLDPIFYFHHCFVDRVFWLWQKKNGFTDHLHVIAEYPGTNSVDSQGPTPGVAPNSWLTLDSPLNPFKNEDGEAYTSRQCINIENQLGYTYGPGSLDEYARETAAAPPEGRSTKTIRVTGINRAAIRGSFLVSAFTNINGTAYHVGTESVLSRWSVQGCANCQTHLEVKAFIGLHSFREESLTNADYEVEIRTRDGILHQHQSLAQPTFQRQSFHVEVA